ncbi:hypothetical protein OS242_08680 [Tumebacillus sp. DT12]|uniref:Transposase n=1 Tax=Tumebacillus lacus TaxID=2995335 RepID=A0ABT3WZG0_9BACL|nr:hypothetical protein [Tumebacillus lacus]MCX7570039.1 hypothetical protein [Tumebacillus lacus]
MIKRDRQRQVIVGHMTVLNISFSSVLQVGDAPVIEPFDYAEAYSGYRGAASFVTEETQKPVNTRLHYANQVDEDVRDSNTLGEEYLEAFEPNIRGVKAR